MGDKQLQGQIKEQLNKYLKGYVCDDFIGNGQHAIVYTGHISRGKESGKKVCLKVEVQFGPGQLNLLNYEVMNLALFSKKDTRIIELIDVQRSISYFDKCKPEWHINVMVTELYGINLKEKLERKEYDDKKLLNWARDAILCISQAHDKEILHQDIRPENFCLNQKEELVLIDFGISKRMRDSILEKSRNAKVTTIEGTQPYVSYWAEKREIQSYRDDVQAIGFMIWEMFTPLPWQGKNPIVMNQMKEKAAELAPDFLKPYFEYCSKLKFGEKVDYKYLSRLLN
jgi:serine/threonine protein kinase